MTDASVLCRVNYGSRCLTCRARCSKCQAMRLIQRYVGRWDADFDKAARFVMSPPIRGAGTAAKLRGGLAGGPLSIVATDHAVFNSTGLWFPLSMQPFVVSIEVVKSCLRGTAAVLCNDT